MNIKDYLHFYIGCQCITDDNKIGRFSGIDICEPDYSIVMITVKFDDEEDFGVYNDNETCDRIKLILRPLSDMTEEEAKEMFLLERSSKFAEWTKIELTKERRTKLDDIDGSEPSYRVRAEYKLPNGKTGGMAGALSLREFNPSQFQYLLSKGFDLFGLHDFVCIKKRNDD